MLEVMFAEQEHREALEQLAKISKLVNEMVRLWTRWGNWENHPPVVVVDGGKVVGVHAVAFTKSGYANSMYQYVVESYRGRRLAGEMVEFILEEAAIEGVGRLKFRAPVGGDGDVFWQGFGLKPFGVAGDEHFYDLSLDGVKRASDLHAGLCDIVTTDKRSITHYRKLGVECLNPAWKDVLEG